MPTVPVSALTEARIDGNGVFDVLMKAFRQHLELEYKQNRIKGPEYSSVYLGGLQAILEQAVAFLLAKDKSDAELRLLEAQIALVEQQTRNAEAEYENLLAQGCLLRAQYDLTMENKLKAVAETGLLNQKTATERAQTIGSGVDEDSVIGKQKQLYQAQADGFQRDAEQKAAKILIDTWNVRRTTDESTVADSTNKLNDVTIGRAVEKLMDGINA